MSKPPRLVLGVVLARWLHAAAGNICSIMHWAIGFRELGWEVWITEHLSSSELGPPESPGLVSPQEEYWKSIVEEYGFHSCQCLLIDGKSPQLEAFREFAASADLFINYAGHYERLDLIGARTVKAYLDVDPTFTQLWVEVTKSDMNLEGHDVFLTVGTTLSSPGVLSPTLGLEWIPVFPPVLAAFWRKKLGTVPSVAAASWTTIAHWYGYPELEWQGRRYAGKRESLVKMKDLPQSLHRPCAIATDLAPDWDDYAPFTEAGWRFIPASQVCKDVPSYLRFIAESRGEIGIAKEGYIVSRGGWMSDRSVVYLALGRPVVLQETGWTGAIAPSEGMLVFHDIRDCAEAIQLIEADYEAHSRAAEALAVTVFSPQGALRPLLEKIL
ncbi:MAG: hypothetical protein WA376_03865 [Terrimicrobiaceae bacterium]